MRRLAWYFTALTAITWVLVIFGAVVRAQGAGMACPDWPLCFGELVPVLDFGVILEWGHRTLAGGVSLLLVAGSVFVLRSAEARAKVGWNLLAAFLILAVQVVLGGLTVLHLLASWTVTSHLVCGNAFALSLALIARRLFQGSEPQPVATSPLQGALVGIVALLTLTQLTLGGLVASNFAGLVCVEWPTCVGGQWFPTFEGPIGLQLLHRLGAYALTLSYGGLAVALWRHERLGSLARIGLVLVLTQVAVGVANVLLHMPVEVTAAHSALASGLVISTGLLVHETFSARSRGALPSPALATAA